MKTKIQIKTVLGKLLFEYEKENNSIKTTLIEAVDRCADLRGADLRGADLRGAYLGGAYLGGADLRGADLRGADLPMYCKWEFSIKDKKLKIGCKEKTFNQWEKWFSSSEEFETKRDSDEFKQIEAMYRGYKAYYEHLNSKTEIL